jgi:hypothetical protein
MSDVDKNARAVAQPLPSLTSGRHQLTGTGRGSLALKDLDYGRNSDSVTMLAQSWPAYSSPN